MLFLGLLPCFAGAHPLVALSGEYDDMVPEDTVMMAFIQGVYLEFLWFVQVVWGTGIFWEVASPSLGLALLLSRCSSFFLYPRSFLLVFSLIPHFGRAHFPEIS